jgi:hypothetical protein
MLLAAGSANAASFTVNWSGGRFGNDASAVGVFDIDTSVVPDLGGIQNTHFLPDPAFHIVSLTVTGTLGGAGDGSYTEADFGSYYFAANSPLDYSKQLIGQTMANGCTFGSFSACYGGPSGDFNLFAATQTNTQLPTNAAAPNGTFYFQLTTGNGENLGVTSIAPTVSATPEPATWGMMLVGFGLAGAALRRRKAKATLGYA